MHSTDLWWPALKYVDDLFIGVCFFSNRFLRIVDGFAEKFAVHPLSSEDTGLYSTLWPENVRYN